MKASRLEQWAILVDVDVGADVDVDAVADSWLDTAININIRIKKQAKVVGDVS